MKVKEESEKAGLKLNNQKTKTRASSPITSWQIDGETIDYMACIHTHTHTHTHTHMHVCMYGLIIVWL